MDEAGWSLLIMRKNDGQIWLLQIVKKPKEKSDNQTNRLGFCAFIWGLGQETGLIATSDASSTLHNFVVVKSSLDLLGWSNNFCFQNKDQNCGNKL